VVDQVFERISSLLKKPREEGNPLIASQPAIIVREGDRHVLLQPAHPADVLLLVHPVDDRSRTEEEERREEAACVTTWKTPAVVAPTAAGQETCSPSCDDGRIGEHLL
jgi:hypothetical protein